MTEGVRIRMMMQESVASDAGTDLAVALIGAGLACVLSRVLPRVAVALVWIGVAVTAVFVLQLGVRLASRRRLGPGRIGRHHSGPALSALVLDALVRVGVLLVAAEVVFR